MTLRTGQHLQASVMLRLLVYRGCLSKSFLFMSGGPSPGLSKRTGLLAPLPCRLLHILRCGHRVSRTD